MGPDVFEIRIAHVVDAEDVDVGVLGDACLDVGVEFDGELFAFLGGFGHMHRFGALGFRHRGELFGFVLSCFLEVLGLRTF